MTSGHTSVVSEATTSDGLTGWIRRAVPTAVVLAALVSLALWGHHTEWRFGFGHREAMPDTGTGPLATIRLGRGVLSNESTLPDGTALVFRSAEDIDRAGIDSAPVWKTAMTEYLSGSGELSFDPGGMSRLSARAAGSVWRVLKYVGDEVQAGEVIALVEAGDVGKGKAEFQQALVQFRLKQKTLTDLRAAGGAVNQRQVGEATAGFRDAQVRLLAAEQTLVNLGLPIQANDFATVTLDAVVQRMRGIGVPANVGFDAENGTANLLPVRAPFAGRVLSVDVVAGEVVDTSRTLMVIVDPRVLWLTVHVPQDAVKRVAVNQVVHYRPDGRTDDVTGRIVWIGTAADETTRTVPVRAALTNSDGGLRASTLGQARIVVRENPSAITVPRDAVQTWRGQAIVFVRHQDFLKSDGPKEFAIRFVLTGANDGVNVEIMKGLSAQDVVAHKGAAVLLAELERLAQSANTTATRQLLKNGGAQ